MRALVVGAWALLMLAPAPALARDRGSPGLLDAASYEGSLRAARQVLQGQSHLVRLRRDLPTVLIPDLHGRRDYLDRVLSTRDPASGRSYAELLRRGQVQVVCLGDVMHTERRAGLWRRGMPQRAMRLEMAESLGTLKRIAELKTAHPDHFHLLRGNHDDVGPAQDDPCRLPVQIAATRRFVENTFGRPLLCELAQFFAALPVAASGKGFVAAHAAPMFAVTRRDVERGTDRALASLSRTRVPSFQQLRRAHAPVQRRSGGSALQAVARTLGADPRRDFYIHGHLWARPMHVNQQHRQVFFGNPEQQIFLRLDPRHGPGELQPWNALFEAGSGRHVLVPAPRRGDI